MINAYILLYKFNKLYNRAFVFHIQYNTIEEKYTLKFEKIFIVNILKCTSFQIQNILRIEKKQEMNPAPVM